MKWCLSGVAGAMVMPHGLPSIQLDTGQLVRVCIDSVSVYKEPSDKSQILYQRTRDELVNTYYKVTSKDGPSYNPIWYRVWGGYIHSAHLQEVSVKLNQVLTSIPDTWQLAEVTVPFTQAKWNRGSLGWQDVYRLYYQSTHWIAGIGTGPDGGVWYKLHDELNEAEYYVQAEHLRPVDPTELTPISSDVPDAKKRIEVNLATQTLTAYEDTKVVLQTKISSGMADSERIPGVISTKTPQGEFHIELKMPSKHMGLGELTDDLDAYILPGVPWTSFFLPESGEFEGVAFHGTYWHDNFGTPMSHGCVNMRVEEAKWLFRWTSPFNGGDKVDVPGYGTRVIVY